MPSRQRAVPGRSFDVHGYKLRVDGPATGWFASEFRDFAMEDTARHPELRVAPDAGRTPKDVYPKGSRTGLSIRPAANGFELLYDAGLDPTHLTGWAETLMEWPTRTLAHAGGVVKDGIATVLFAGPNTGKTTTVVGLLQRGFDYLGDDWVIVGDGRAWPFPKTLHLYDYNLAKDDVLAARVLAGRPGARSMARTRLLVKDRIVPHLPTRALRYGAEVALARRMLRARPEDVNAESKVAGDAPLATAVWMRRCETARIQAQPMDLDDMVERILNVKVFERMPHLGPLALAAAEHGFPFDIAQRREHDRSILHTTLSKSRRFRLDIPRLAAGADVIDAVERLISAAPMKGR